MSQICFKGSIEIIGINPYVLISKEIAEKLKPNWKKPLPVLVKINNKPDEPWHINMMPKGNGEFYLYLHEIVRKASNTKVGDVVEVEVAFDEDYKNGPMHEMPEWFRLALDKNAKANENWEALTPSRKKEILRYFDGLKSDKAKLRNLVKTMNVLSGNPGRFMARSWSNGR